MPLEFNTLSFFNHFSELEDPRIDRKKLYPLEEILFVTLCAVICGAESWYDIEDFGEARIRFLRRYYLFKNGIPSHDTIGRLFSLLDPTIFKDCFINWVKAIQVSIPELIAIDGKTLRHSFDKANNKPAIHMLSAFASNARLVLGQTKVDAKTNEITAIPKLLDLLVIKGAIITIDAMGCQKEIAKKIIDKNADYIFGLKGNQGDLHENIETYFNDKTLSFDCYEETDKGHGRIEIRKIYVTTSIDWLEQKKYWKGLSSIIKVESTRILQNKKTTEFRYYISSLKSSPQKILQAIRSHWGIENSLHWVLDLTFREDECRIRKKNAPENMAIIRHIVFNILQHADNKISIRRRKKKAGWSDEYLENVLKQKF